MEGKGEQQILFEDDNQKGNNGNGLRGVDFAGTAVSRWVRERM